MEREANRDAAPTGAVVAEAADPDRFLLRNEPPKRKAASFSNSEAVRQAMLLDGLHCLARQRDLF